MDQLGLPLAWPSKPQRRWRHLRTRLERIFIDEIGAYPGRLSLLTLEGCATAAYRRGGFGRVLRVDPFWLLRCHEIRWRIGHPVGSSGAQLVNHAIVIYRAALRGRELGLAILHELAHWLLDEYHRGEHDQRDVWLLTLLLAFPAPHLRVVRAEGWRTETLLRYQPHAERWALRERAHIARRLTEAA